MEVDACGDAQSAAEGAMLGLFHYDQLKSKKKTKVTTQLHGRYTQRDHQTGVCDTCKFQYSVITIISSCVTLHASVCACSVDTAGWERGVLYGEGQNLARFLMEAPANHITPTEFANTIEEKLAPHAEFVAVEKRFVLYSTLLCALPQMFTLRHCIVNMSTLKMQNTWQQLNSFGVFTFWLLLF